MLDRLKRQIGNVELWYQEKGRDLFPRLWDFLHFLSKQKFVTCLTGPLYERSRRFIELDITYVCNLRCFNCNRSCGQAPSEDRLSLEQIRKFIRESTAQGSHWQRIRVLGGEPTMHPDFFQIVEELLAFRSKHHPEDTIIEVVTNGFGNRVNEVLARLGPEVVVVNTAKKSRAQKFNPFNLAPQDFAIYRYADYASGCWFARDCGLGLSPYGYYPCAVGASIDRVWGFNIGRKALPDPSDPMRDQMAVLCRFCGHFSSLRPIMLDKHLMSASWRQAYERYRSSKPAMIFY